MDSLHPELLTWTGLLGRWMDYARAALALPADAEGERWRASVPAVITLQAVTFALADLADLPVAERAFARDRAAHLIGEQRTALASIWARTPMPETLLEILQDAADAELRSAFAGATELRCGATPIEVTVEADAAGPGSLAVIHPGTIVLPGTPIAWWVDRDDPPFAGQVAGAERVPVAVPHQVYRVPDEEGAIARDVVRSVLDDPVAGFPLLVPLVHRGEAIGALSPASAALVQAQQARTFGDDAPRPDAYPVAWE